MSKGRTTTGGMSRRNATNDGAVSPGEYVLGHSAGELKRLQVQAKLIDPITRRFLRAAGLRAGMRVLDVGSGVGDVAFLAAELIGENGHVVGVDRVADAVAEARARAEARLLDNVTFKIGDPADMAFDRPFDAVIGRYVLQFQEDPTQALRKLAVNVRPGGLVAFHELDWRGVGSFPPVPTYDEFCELVVRTIQSGGASAHLGFELPARFVAAGLPPPTTRMESVMGGPADASEQVHLTTDLAGTLGPQMVALGLATPEQLDVELLTGRVLEEMVATRSVIIGRAEIGAWTEVPLTE